MGIERRKFPRVNAKYQINVVCTGEVIQGEPPRYVFHTYTENISEGGIKIVLEREVKVGSLLELELFITGKESLPIKCKGVVVWTKKSNLEGTKPDLFQTGIQFSDLKSPVYSKLLKDVINYYLGNKTEDKE